MSNPIKINIPKGARMPTEEEIKLAKQYILRREETARMAQDLAGGLIRDAAENLVSIAYKYNIPATDFMFDSSVNPQMMEEVDTVMEELDEELYLLLEEHATSCTKDETHRAQLLPFIASLGHRNMSLRETLYAYEWRTLRQVGALVAAMSFAGVLVSSARSKVRQALATVNTTPELQKAFKQREKFASPYIRDGGYSTYPDGSPNVQGVPHDGFNAINNVFNNVITISWSKHLQDKMVEDDKCIGYWQDRGSQYPCAPCDDEVGFHEIEDGEIIDPPMVHIHCRCYRVPLYQSGEQGTMIYD